MQGKHHAHSFLPSKSSMCSLILQSAYNSNNPISEMNLCEGENNMQSEASSCVGDDKSMWYLRSTCMSRKQEAILKETRFMSTSGFLALFFTLTIILLLEELLQNLHQIIITITICVGSLFPCTFFVFFLAF